MERLKINLRRANPSRKTNAASCDTAPCPTEALLPVATATHAPCSTEYSREILNVRYTITTLKTHSSVFRNLSDEIDSEFEILRVADQALCIYTKARMYVFTWLYFERYCTCAPSPTHIRQRHLGDDWERYLRSKHRIDWKTRSYDRFHDIE